MPAVPHDPKWQKSKPLTDEDVQRVLRDSLRSDHILAEQVQSVMRYHFQQPINCCQTTAVAYALSVLGFPTSPDDIFWTVKVDVDTAVHEGMTLAETHELALRYIEKTRLPVFVDAYHFDAASDIGPDDLWSACLEDEKNGKDDVLAFNFHSGIAHGLENGGGHFALFVAALPETRELIVSDVHPLKYGAHWSVPSGQLFAAMADNDTTVGRARGILRFGLHGKGLQRPLASLAKANRVVDWIAPPDPYLGAYLKRYVPKRWFSFLGARNMEGLSAVALACNVLQERPPQASSMDAIMRALRESYTAELNRFCDAQELHDILARLSAKGFIRSVPSLLPFGAPVEAAVLRSALKSAGCGSAQVAILAPFDISVAYGADMAANESAEANVLSHGTKTWALLAAYDERASDDDLGGLVVASAHSVITYGRLWRCSLERMARAIQAVGCEQLVILSSENLIDENARLDEILAIMDENQDGKLNAEELENALNGAGLAVSSEQAEVLVSEASNSGGKDLDHTEAVEMLVEAVGHHPDHAKEGHPRYEAVSKFMAEHGCVPNELGFATVHLALCTADIPRCVKFYNNVVGWPLYKTVDRAHAGSAKESYGSSWASFGAFASFIVFHQEDVPLGRQGHGPWADPNTTPEGLRDPASKQTNISFRDIPFPAFGVLLEPGFFEIQMKRIAQKDDSVRWLEIEGVESLFGGSEIASAVVFRDPDGYPLIFFVSTLAGDAYRDRFPATPFVYGTDIKAAYPSAEDEAEKKKADTAWIASCPTIRKYRSSESTRPMVERWLRTYAYTKNSLQQHLAYYDTVPHCEKVAEVNDQEAQVIQLEYTWDKHFMILRTNRKHDGALVGASKQDHDMGGNKGRVPVPHFGVNTSHDQFSSIRNTVTTAMKEHGVPYDMCVSLSAMGHAPPYNALDSYHLLFPTDPDACLSIICCDPGGNMNEIKFYLDFGEMFHTSGSIGLGDLTIDNSMVELHFPPAVLRMLEKRGLRGDEDGLEVLREEQKNLEDRGVVDDDDLRK